MCTKPRIIVPNIFYEITSRGVQGIKIFPNDDFKSFFLKELVLTLRKFSFQCYAWSIMDDHYHLVVKSSTFSISRFMQRLNCNYARYFNKKTSSKGVVFYRRFASVVVQEKNSLEETIRYVHLNPIRSGDCILEELHHYKWSGHCSIVNNNMDNILNIKDILDHFDESPAAYLHFINSREDESKTILKVRAVHEGGQHFSDPQCWIIGDDTFTQSIISQDKCRRLRLARYVRENITVSNVLERIKSCIDIKDAPIFLHGRLNELSTARQMFAIIGHCHFEFTCASLAHFLRVSGSAVSSMISRGYRIMGVDYLSEMICTV